MNLLTSMGLLPLIGAGLIALLPATNAKLVKQSALLVSVLVAALGITMTIGFDRGVTGFHMLSDIHGFHPLELAINLESMEYH